MSEREQSPQVVDKAGTEYWDTNWDGKALLPPLDPADVSLNNYVSLEMIRTFGRWFGGRRGIRVLEIGCANSVWPIFFHQHWGAHVAGLDYSEIGCENSRRMFSAYGVPGEVHHADLFSPPAPLRRQFDVVISFGVVEHFQDTAGCLSACAEFLAPGGRLVTVIPNLAGVIGWIQQYVDRDILDVHVRLDREQFAEAHRAAALELIECEYFLPINLGVVNSGTRTQSVWNPYFRRVLSAISKTVWALDRVGAKLPPNRVTSPYVIALARARA